MNNVFGKILFYIKKLKEIVWFIWEENRSKSGQTWNKIKKIINLSTSIILYYLQL